MSEEILLPIRTFLVALFQPCQRIVRRGACRGSRLPGGRWLRYEFVRIYLIQFVVRRAQRARGPRRPAALGRVLPPKFAASIAPVRDLLCPKDVIDPETRRGQALVRDRLVPFRPHGPRRAERALPIAALVGELRLGVRAYRFRTRRPAQDVVDLLTARLVPALSYHVLAPQVEEIIATAPPGRRRHLTDPAFPVTAIVAISVADGSARGGTFEYAIDAEGRVESTARRRLRLEVYGRRGVQLVSVLAERADRPILDDGGDAGRRADGWRGSIPAVALTGGGVTSRFYFEFVVNLCLFLLPGKIYDDTKKSKNPDVNISHYYDARRRALTYWRNTPPPPDSRSCPRSDSTSNMRRLRPSSLCRRRNDAATRRRS